MKKRLFLFHSWLGLIAGLGLLVIGLTGSALVFKAEINAVLMPEVVKTKTTDQPRLLLDALFAGARKQLAGYEIVGLDIEHQAGYADQVYVVKHGGTEWETFYVDPATGEGRHSPESDENTLMGWLLELHYAFLAGHTGMAVTGVLAAMLCLLGITGVWLYRGFWKTLFTLRWGRSARIFFSDVHKMVGITSTVFNLILGFTGAWWNLSHVIGEFVTGEPEPAKVMGPGYAESISFDALMEVARKEIPGFQPNFFSLPGTPEEDITFYGGFEGQNVLRSPYGSMVSFDSQTGLVKSVEDVRKGTVWNAVLDSFRPLHYGTFGGLPVKILWVLGGLAPGVLAVSGSLMYSRRKWRAA